MIMNQNVRRGSVLKPSNLSIANEYMINNFKFKYKLEKNAIYYVGMSVYSVEFSSDEVINSNLPFFCVEQLDHVFDSHLTIDKVYKESESKEGYSQIVPVPGFRFSELEANHLKILDSLVYKKVSKYLNYSEDQIKNTYYNDCFFDLVSYDCLFVILTEIYKYYPKIFEIISKSKSFDFKKCFFGKDYLKVDDYQLQSLFVTFSISLKYEQLKIGLLDEIYADCINKYALDLDSSATTTFLHSSLENIEIDMISSNSRARFPSANSSSLSVEVLHQPKSVFQHIVNFLKVPLTQEEFNIELENFGDEEAEYIGDLVLNRLIAEEILGKKNLKGTRQLMTKAKSNAFYSDWIQSKFGIRKSGSGDDLEKAVWFFEKAKINIAPLVKEMVRYFLEHNEIDEAESARMDLHIKQHSDKTKNSIVWKDYVSKLYRIVQMNDWEISVKEGIKEDLFTNTISIKNHKMFENGYGEAKSKSDAKQLAAKDLLEKLSNS